MYVTSQWVVASGGAEGVNAFYYRHGSLDWSGIPPEGIPQSNPGTLVNETVAVPPPGNRVRAYLDVAAPDGTPWPEVQQNLVAFVADIQSEQLPWEGIRGRCYFRIEFGHDLASSWQQVLGDLINAAHRVLVTKPSGTSS